MPLLPATTVISPDEKAWSLAEVIRQAPDYKGFRRYQHVIVVRGDKLAEFVVDMGRATKYRADQFRIPSLMEHTVGELWDIADRLRETAPARDRVEPTDLVGEYNKLLEWRTKANRARRSSRRRKLIHA